MNTKTKQTSKHTAGEWTINIINQPMGNHKTNREILYKINQEKMPIDIHPDEESSANARLIASAPDLLQACEAALDYIENSNGIMSFTADKIRKAIAKAKGE